MRSSPTRRGRLAPYAKAPAETGIEGSYIVNVAPGADPAVVAARLEVAPTSVLRHALSGFAADLDEGRLDRVRRDPDVTDVEQDAHVWLND